MDIEGDEDEDLICTRTFNMHKECVVLIIEAPEIVNSLMWNFLKEHLTSST